MSASMSPRHKAALLCTLILTLPGRPAVLAAGASASEILEVSGVKGGLVVHLDCGDGRLTAELARNGAYVVHGLETDPVEVQKARRYLLARKELGRVSVELFTGRTLPYADNLVNLIVAEERGEVAEDELMRVLVPGGVAYIKDGDTWQKRVKPRPGNIDEWTHYLHDATNNAVSHDKLVGPPRYIQWIAGPKFARAHEQLASISAMVSAGGRVFYIIDEGPRADIRLPAQWRLIARDAFNGVLLWKRPIRTWADHLRRFRSGPPDLAFRLVTDGPRVYVTEGIAAPVTVIDAAEGKTLWVYEGTENTRQILRFGGKLALLVDTQPQTSSQNESEIRRGLKPAPGRRAIIVANALADEILWKKDIGPLVHPTVAAQDGRVFYQTHDTLFCVDAESGDELWRAPIKTELQGHEVGWESPTLVVSGQVVYYADFKTMTAFAVKDGRRLWDCPAIAGYNSPPDVFVIDGLVWLQDKQLRRLGRDPRTGEVARVVQALKGYMHHRCYRNKATDRFILLGAQGVQLLDITSGQRWLNYWIRGTCQYGIMPANGLLYVPPDSCACNLKTKLNGFFALGSTRAPAQKTPDERRLQKGPAYALAAAARPVPAQPADWPTYRHDAARSGMTDARIPAELREKWRADIGEKLSAPTVAAGKVFVAAVDAHSLYVLDAETGKTCWTFTAGGRIDSPPTIHDGLVLFGSADGCVYALLAADGRLAWRFQAAPKERRIVVNGQLESAWPVHGSTLVKDGQLVVTAGRSSYVDGGIHALRLNPHTGREISRTVIYSPENGKQPAEGGRELRGALSDILSSLGDDIYMRHMKLDFATGDQTGTGVHLFTPVGFLDDTWWHRAYWVVSDKFLSHWSAWWKIGNLVPSGRILSYDESAVYGYGRDRYLSGNTGQWRGGEKYQLFAHDRGPARPPELPKPHKGKRMPASASALKYRWTRQVPMFVTAMLVAGEKMFIAGPPDVIKAQADSSDQALMLENPQEALQAWTGEKGGALLWAVSTRDGRPLGRLKLDAQPVFDGMAAAGGRLFLSRKDGKVICLAGQ